MANTNKEILNFHLGTIKSKRDEKEGLKSPSILNGLLIAVISVNAIGSLKKTGSLLEAGSQWLSSWIY
jgi:hypothetical protein